VLGDETQTPLIRGAETRTTMIVVRSRLTILVHAAVPAPGAA
jgi:hypothetical protein